MHSEILSVAVSGFCVARRQGRRVAQLRPGKATLPPPLDILLGHCRLGSAAVEISSRPFPWTSNAYVCVWFHGSICMRVHIHVCLFVETSGHGCAPVVVLPPPIQEEIEFVMRSAVDNMGSRPTLARLGKIGLGIYQIVAKNPARTPKVCPTRISSAYVRLCVQADRLRAGGRLRCIAEVNPRRRLGVRISICISVSAAGSQGGRGGRPCSVAEPGFHAKMGPHTPGLGVDGSSCCRPGTERGRRSWRSLVDPADRTGVANVGVSSRTSELRQKGRGMSVSRGRLPSSDSHRRRRTSAARLLVQPIVRKRRPTHVTSLRNSAPWVACPSRPSPVTARQDTTMWAGPLEAIVVLTQPFAGASGARQRGMRADELVESRHRGA